MVKKYTWYKDIKGYITTKINNKLIKMHRLILSNYYNIENIIVDHKDTIRYNNRKENLRLCNMTKNAYNQKINKDNTSGYTEVTLNKRENRWKARISIDNKRKTIGSCKDFYDAVKIRIEGEFMHYKEFRHKYEGRDPRIIAIEKEISNKQTVQ